MNKKKLARIYKITCDFYVRAKNKNEVEQHIVDDGDINAFIDSHLIIKEAKGKIYPADIWR